MKPEFSIVIPVFNAAVTLPETLDSVTAQTYPNYELIVVDDGSTDNSVYLLNQWAEHKEIDFKLLQQENAGLGAARNSGIAKASKTWVALLDADDTWHSKKLEILAGEIERVPADVFYHDVRTFGQRKNYRRKAFPLQSVEDVLLRGNPLVPSATVIKREALEEFPFSEDRSHHGAEDLHLWLRLLKAGKKFHPLNKVLSFYRESGGMSSELDDHLKYVFKVLEDLHSEKLINADLLQAGKRRKHYEAARFLQKRGSFSKARHHYHLAGIIGLRHKLLYLANQLKLAL